MAVLILLQLVLASPAQVAQISSTANLDLPEVTLVEVDNALVEYQAQVASRDPLEAMAVLDAIGNVIFWRLEGYDISWNPQDQTLAVSLNGLAAPDVATGLDAEGRQAFVIPLPDSEDFLTGWVDVDMAHNRVIMRSTSLPIDIFIPFAAEDDGTMLLIGPTGKGCACVSNGTMVQWCTYRSYCVDRNPCTNGHGAQGDCRWRAPGFALDLNEPPVIQPG